MVCVICQDGIADNDKLFVTSCAHTFHEQCWTDYVGHQQDIVVCPICKTYQNETPIENVSHQDTVLTIVVASSPSSTYLEHDTSITPKYTCSKHLFVIISLLIVLIVISTACLVTIMN